MPPSTLPSTLTCEGSTRVGAGEDATTFFSLLLRSLYGGVASYNTCSGVNPLLTAQSFFRTQSSSPTPLSRQCAHLEWPSKLAITWPQVPRFCPAEDIFLEKFIETLGSKIQTDELDVGVKLRLC